MRGNGKIIQELESFFRGAGWNVIKVVWGREWDDLLARDTDGALVNLMNVTPDGDYQTYKAESGAYVRENFFGRDPRDARAGQGLHRRPALEPQARRPRLPQGLRGVQGRRRSTRASRPSSSPRRSRATASARRFEGRNATHQMKKLTLDNLKQFRDVMRIPITDAQLEENPYQPPYYHPGADDEAIQYLQERRRALGGYLPERRSKYTQIALPDDSRLRDRRRRAPASRRSPPPWRSPAC